ncbi:MAG: phosphate signaling complex protein PhoU [Holophagae bacterium]|jgi:phosphate transport system protein
MPRIFDTDLNAIKQELLTMAGLAEKSLDDVAKVLATGDRELARSVIERDDRIDRCELTIDRLGTEFIVRHHPMAGDLRFIITAIKIAPRLERIGDNAVNIARYVLDIMAGPWSAPVPEVPRILAQARAMVTDVVTAFVSRDADRAREIIRRDDQVDRLYWNLFRALLDRIRTEPEAVHNLITQVLVARFAERIGDQATNIAEEIIYLVEGAPVKHSPLPPTANR